MQKSSKDPVLRFQGMCLYAECILFDYIYIGSFSQENYFKNTLKCMGTFEINFCLPTLM